MPGEDPAPAAAVVPGVGVVLEGEGVKEKFAVFDQFAARAAFDDWDRFTGVFVGAVAEKVVVFVTLLVRLPVELKLAVRVPLGRTMMVGRFEFEFIPRFWFMPQPEFMPQFWFM